MNPAHVLRPAQPRKGPVEVPMRPRTSPSAKETPRGAGQAFPWSGHQSQIACPLRFLTIPGYPYAWRTGVRSRGAASRSGSGLTWRAATPLSAQGSQPLPPTGCWSRPRSMGNHAVQRSACRRRRTQTRSVGKPRSRSIRAARRFGAQSSSAVARSSWGTAAWTSAPRA